jgi:signal peptidase I
VVAAAGLGLSDDPAVEAQPAPQSPPQVEAWVRYEGNSMSPVLTDGQRYPLDVLAYVDRAPQRGDIVAVADPREPATVIVKRVIGLPGETIEIVDDIVHVNGEALAEDYVAAPWADSLQPLEVPAGSFFVLGDNRANSLDSRSADIGPIPGDLILGKVVFDQADRRRPERHDLDPTPPAP